jgi:hypothetical protein
MLKSRYDNRRRKNMGKYTSDFLLPLVEKRKDLESYCIYCHCESASTRDHIPPRVFLDEPYPSYLDVVPACDLCNKSFSSDELYVSCYLDLFRNFLSDNNIKLRSKTIKALKYDESLLKKLNEQIYVKSDQVMSFNSSSFNRILEKLSLGHICRMHDRVIYDKKSIIIEYKFLNQMTREDLSVFDETFSVEIAGEIGSDYVERLYVRTSINNSNSSSDIIADWSYIQNGNYRYLAFIDNGTYKIKISIFEVIFIEASLTTVDN